MGRQLSIRFCCMWENVKKENGEIRAGLWEGSYPLDSVVCGKMFILFSFPHTPSPTPPNNNNLGLGVFM